MRIALLGTRGIPARYGGFETFAEEVSRQLVALGHEVVVYGRRRFFDLSSDDRTVHGVGVRSRPTIMHKYLETPLHALTSFLDPQLKNFDVVLLCNAANSPFAWIGRLRGLPLAINVDGIERRRSKWNAIGRLWYRLGELSSVMFGSAVVSDAQVIADYYRESYGCESHVIAYGARAVHVPAGETLKQFNLKPREYILYVSRLEPENNALGVVQAYAKSHVTLPLVIVGDAPYAHDYIRQVKEAAPLNVVFTGYQFGAAYQELQSNARIYIQATEVGGTHPALIESMAYGNCIVANGTPENLEVLGGAGEFYRRNDFDHLAGKIAELNSNPERIQEYGTLAKRRAESRYTWDKVAGQYTELFSELCAVTTST